MAPTAEPFLHLAVFYRDTAAYLSATVAFVREGLAASEPVAIAVPEPRLTQLRHALGGDAGNVKMLDIGLIGRNPGCIIPLVLRAFADEHETGRVRIIGEPIWPTRTEDEYPACVQHEALINTALAGRTVTLLCPYDESALTERAIVDARCTHPTLIGGGRYWTSSEYDPVGAWRRYNVPLTPGPEAVRWDFDRSLLPTVRSVVARHAGQLGLHRDLVPDFAVAASELMTNSVRHGDGRGTIHVWSTAGRVVAQVHDLGRMGDPLVGSRRIAPASHDGRGLLLVNQVAALVRMHLSDAGTTIRFEIDRG